MPRTLEEAIQIIQQLQAGNAQLRADNAALNQQIAELTARMDKAERQKAPPPVKAATPRPEPKPRRKRDPQHNRGRTRQKPTRIETHACDHCPDCGVCQTFFRSWERERLARPGVDKMPALPGGMIVYLGACSPIGAVPMRSYRCDISHSTAVCSGQNLAAEKHLSHPTSYVIFDIWML